MHFRSIYSFCITLSVIAPLTTSSYADFVTKKDALDYEQCTQLVANDTTKAMTMATQWVKSDNSAAAYHCKAMAEFKLKRYSAAAVTLNRMYALLPLSEYGVRNHVVQQAVKAWQLAGEAQQAQTLLSSHILTLLAQDNSDMDLAYALTERSKIFRTGKQPLKALQDVDHALSLIMSVAALSERARIYLDMQEYELAHKDIEQALRNNPTDVDAQKLMIQIKAKL